MTKKKTVLLIDGDVFVYQAGLAVEVETNWGDGLWTLHSDLSHGKDYVAYKIENLKKTLGADEVRFALSCPTDEGFRRGIALTYKANRKDARKPVIHRPLREAIIAEYDAVLRDGLEADDILGILATQPTNERRIIVSVDKDFHGVPALFYRITSDNPEVVEVTKESAVLFHALQTLAGDRVDGYQGK